MDIHKHILLLRSKKLSYRKIAKKLGVGKTCVEYHCNKTRFIDKQQRIRRAKKIALLDLSGNSCCKCGYNKSISALDFHHKDPKSKVISISNGVRQSWSLDALKKEAAKCILLCSNCHHEVHDGITSI